MNYRFEISYPDTEFRCEIAIAGEQTFRQLHDKIVEIVEYDGSQMASFYALNSEGERVKEIALMDMELGDEDIMIMENAKIEDVVNADCIELEYVYDFFNNKYFKVEYAGEYKGKFDVLPVCVYCEGEIPEQYDPDEEWNFNKSDDDEYDDSFMEEFNDYSDEGGFEDGEDNFGDEDDFGGGGYSSGSAYDSIDDYIDKY